ncbi:MAG: HNH endonuclease [Candidatus Uhrbacteria bacterium]|nr:HNH endonuclease [Candidatus Uhrbacteria bacterium]
MAPSVKKFLIIVVIGTVLGMAYGARAHKEPASPETLRAIARADTYVLQPRSKLVGCTIRGAYPDPECTPGSIFEQATKEEICVSGYSRSVRDVSSGKKESIYAAYGITSRSPGQYKIDHLISLQLGGSNESANLFPKAAEPRPGFHEKDEMENYLHAQMCEGNITLREAQILISRHWLEVYNLLH